MSYIDSIVLGIIQGLTEFLPISSSGHLVLTQYWLDIESDDILLEIVVHLGTLCSILFYYRFEIKSLLNDIRAKRKSGIDYLLMILVSTLPAIFLGFILKSKIELLFNPSYVPYMFLLTGLVLLSTKFLSKTVKKSLSIKSAIIIGFFQAFAMIPGISRSGMTISIALILGINRSEAAKFSFFIAIPILAGAGILELSSISNLEFDFLPLLTSFVLSFVSGYLVISFLIKIISNDSFWKFSIYCIIVGLLFIVFGIDN